MKKTILKINTIIGLLVFSLVFCSLAYAIELPNINKSKIRLSIAAGKSEYGQIVVENQSSEARSMRVYLSDWNYLPSADGTKEFLPVSTVPTSCSSWISFSPAEFTLAPFSKQEINYSVKVPLGASGGYYAALFFESIFGRTETEREEMKVGMNLAIRIATLFYVDVQGTVKRTATIDNLSFYKNASGGYSLGLDFSNTGNTDITTSGTFHIMDSQGMVITRGILNDSYTFAGSSAKLTATIKDNLPQGKYDLVFTVDLGKALAEAGVGRGPIITKEVELQISRSGEVLSISQLE